MRTVKCLRRAQAEGGKIFGEAEKIFSTVVLRMAVGVKLCARPTVERTGGQLQRRRRLSVAATADRREVGAATDKHRRRWQLLLPMNADAMFHIVLTFDSPYNFKNCICNSISVPIVIFRST